MSIQAQAFIEQLKDQTFRDRLAPALQVVPEGRWDIIVSIARQEGYDFSVAELKSVVPKSFFKGHGKNKNMGWAWKTRLS